VKGQNQDFSLDTSDQRERKIGFFSQSSKAQDAVQFLKQSYFSDILVQSDPGCVIQIKFSDCGMSEALENALRLAEGFRRH
jgi:hypothetical protein